MPLFETINSDSLKKRIPDLFYMILFRNVNEVFCFTFLLSRVMMTKLLSFMRLYRNIKVYYINQSAFSSIPHVSSTILEMLTNTSYSETAARFGNVLRDQMESPLVMATSRIFANKPSQARRSSWLAWLASWACKLGTSQMMIQKLTCLLKYCTFRKV